MSTKQYYHNIDLQSVGQLVGARYHNVTNDEMTTLAGTLGAANAGLFVYNTDEKAEFIWDGSQFVEQAIRVLGDLVFRGVIEDPANPVEVEKVAGYQYVVNAAGELAIDGVTISGDATVEQGDQVILASSSGGEVADTAYIVQKNDDTVAQNARIDAIEAKNTEQDGRLTQNESDISDLQARADETDTEQTAQDNRLTALETRADETDTEQTAQDNRLADLETRADETDTEQTAQDNRLTDLETRADETDAEQTAQDNRLTSLEARDEVKTFFATTDLSVGSNTITHSLDLSDKDAFTIRVADASGSDISLDVDSVDVNSLTLSTLLSLTSVKVSVIGF